MKTEIGSIVKRRPQKKKRLPKEVSMAIFTILFLGVIALAAFYFMSPSEGSFTLTYYTFAEVGQRDFAINVSTSGTVVPRKQETLRSQFAGIVKEVLFIEGSDVKQGDILVILESQELEDRQRDAQRQVEQASEDLYRLMFDQGMDQERLLRDLESARKNYNDAKEDHALKELSYAHGLISKKELERSYDTVVDAEYSLNRAERQIEETFRRQELALQQAEEKYLAELASLSEIEKNIDALNVKAPFSGRILELNVREDLNINNNAQIMILADVANPIVRTQLDANMIDLLETGHEASIKTGVNEYSGLITYIAPVAVDMGGTPMVETHLQFNNVVEGLRPNTAVNVDIEVGRRLNSPYLPRGAYISSGQQQFVYILQEDIAIRREVRYGIMTGTIVEVIIGLEPGDLVITSSYDEFRHLTEVKVNPEGGRKQ